MLFPQYQYTKWAKTYGRVYTVMLGDTAHVVVSGLQEVRDIFIKQGANSQARPPSRFQLLMRDGYFPGLMNGEKWRHARKMWQTVLNGSAAKQYLPYQELETRQLLFDLLQAPNEWRDHIERYSNSVAMTMVNSRRIVSSADARVKETIQDLYDLSETGVRGAFLDSWPFLWKIPQWFFPVCKRAREIAAKHRDLIWRNYSDVQDRTVKGAALPSFNHAIQEKLKQGWPGVSEIEGAEIGHHLLTGTTDTTASSLINWVAAMCLNPEAQKKAQEGNISSALYTVLQRTITQIVQRSTGLLVLIVCPRTMTQRGCHTPDRSSKSKSRSLQKHDYLMTSRTSYKDDLRPGFIVCLNPFSAHIAPRSPKHAQLIRKTWMEELEVSLDQNQQWKATPEGIARLIDRAGK
ncbi:hypothetical protein MAP00_005095 [Monascus purpureus]|nr:hypothetical protein MAP00_005095 [Monascus purpureus]